MVNQHKAWLWTLLWAFGLAIFMFAPRIDAVRPNGVLHVPVILLLIFPGWALTLIGAYHLPARAALRKGFMASITIMVSLSVLFALAFVWGGSSLTSFLVATWITVSLFATTVICYIDWLFKDIRSDWSKIKVKLAALPVDASFRLRVRTFWETPE